MRPFSNQRQKQLLKLLRSALGGYTQQGPEYNFKCPFCLERGSNHVGTLHINLSKNAAICLSGTQTVFTSDGKIPIYRIASALKRNPELKALSHDFRTGNDVWRKIVRTYSNGKHSGHFLKILTTISKQRGATVTPDHKMFLGSGEKVRASSLQVGDVISATGYDFSDDQIQVLYGTVLGDAHISPSAQDVSFEHGAGQEYYLRWKAEQFPRHSIRERVIDDKWGKRTCWQALASGAPHVYEAARKLFYPNGVKIAPADALGRLNVLGLAVWFMDDWSVRYESRAWRSELCCELFDADSVIRIKRWLLRSYGVRSMIAETGRLRFSSAATKKLLALFERYIRYEPRTVDGKCHRELKKFLCPSITKGANGRISVPITKIEKVFVPDGSKSERYKRYDIEVDDTHNYYVGKGVLVSNCHSCRFGTRNVLYIIRDVLGYMPHGGADAERDLVLLSTKKSKFKKQVRRKLWPKQEEAQIIPLPMEFKRLLLPAEGRIAGIMYRYLRWRGVTDDQIDDYGVGYCVTGDFAGYLVFPYYQGGLPVYFTTRAVLTATGKKSLNPKADRRWYLYNYDRAIRQKHIILVEGPLDAIRVGRAAVAVGGKILLDEQIDLLDRDHIEEITVVFDSDAHRETETACVRLVNRLPGKQITYILLEKGDPDDNADNFDELLENRTEMSFGRVIQMKITQTRMDRNNEEYPDDVPIDFQERIRAKLYAGAADE